MKIWLFIFSMAALTLLVLTSTSHGESFVELSIIPDEQDKALKKLYEQFKVADINQTLRKMVEYVMNKNDLFYRVNYV